ncbi:MAG: hypothetical protein Q7T88_07260 [Methylotenera sp.]|nr:hypothetical protein [Methylotenera sp.]
MKGKDYLSIWNLAHRWAGVDVDSTDADNLPEEVQYLIKKIVEGYWNSNLRLRRSNGRKIPRESMLVFFYNLNFWQKALERCLFENEYDKSKLNSYLVGRIDLIRMCEHEDIDPPEFWKRKNQLPVEELKPTVTHRPKDEVTDRLVCQAIARAYWDIDPQIHPAHLAKSRAISLYANGKQYKDENTVKNWIAEVDPFKNQRKIGRPKDVNYLIDLENGVLSQT